MILFFLVYSCFLSVMSWVTVGISIAKIGEPILSCYTPRWILGNVFSAIGFTLLAWYFLTLS
jgi:hypothetical protein